MAVQWPKPPSSPEVNSRKLTDSVGDIERETSRALPRKVHGRRPGPRPAGALHEDSRSAIAAVAFLHEGDAVGGHAHSGHPEVDPRSAGGPVSGKLHRKGQFLHRLYRVRGDVEEDPLIPRERHELSGTGAASGPVPFPESFERLLEVILLDRAVIRLLRDVDGNPQEDGEGRENPGNQPLHGNPAFPRSSIPSPSATSVMVLPMFPSSRTITLPVRRACGPTRSSLSP